MFRITASLLLSMFVFFATQQGYAKAEITPVEKSKPVKVLVQLILVDIDNISTPEQNFTANIYGEFRWHDSTLRHKGKSNKIMSLESIWSPRLQIANRQKVWDTLPHVAVITPNGEVTYRQRVWGDFSQPFDLHKFPFDSQELNLYVVAPGYKVGDVIFGIDKSRPSAIAKKFSQPDWDIIDWNVNVQPYKLAKEVSAAPGVVFTVKIKRFVGYYIFKFMVPLFFIICMSFIIFWIDLSESNTRVGLAATAMLTLIAYRFMIATDLPKVPYLTRMDLFILLSTVLVFVVLTTSAISSALVKNDKIMLARKIDNSFKVAFPLCLMLVIISPFIFY